MSSFYTNVQVYSGKIYYRGVEDGKKISRKVDYRPVLFVRSPDPTEFTALSGEYVAPIEPGTIRDCREFCKQYENVDGFPIYGNQRYEYVYISDKFKETINYELPQITIANLDIECGSEFGFPDPENANEAVTAITFKTEDRFLVFGCGDFNNTRSDVWYIKCKDESDLLKRFIEEWSFDYPDIVTGWNVSLFDIPYLINRISKLLGESYAKRLSPWSVIHDREITYATGKKVKLYTLLGISCLDYLELYKKFSPEGKSQESYKLDSIANVELGEGKLSYDEYGSLHLLYKQNYQKFIEYNVRDVELIDRLEAKLKLIELALTLAYSSKSNYDDVFFQVRMWDAIIFNHLRKKNVVLPPMHRHDKDHSYEGAYVKEPIIGLHKWIVSFDVASMYPMSICQGNLSPETIIDPERYGPELKKLSTKTINIETLLKKEVDTLPLQIAGATVMPNGCFFSVDRKGFMSEIVQNMFDDRQKYKEKMIQAQKELEKTKNKALENDISKYKNLQTTMKVCINSLYGAAGNPYFRLYDLRIATAITTFGQLAIQYIANELNGYLNGLLKTENHDFVIASDTDSVYLSLEKLVQETILKQRPAATDKEIVKFIDKICQAKIQPFIDQAFQNLAMYLNSYSQKMNMKREAICDKGIWTAKKRYILSVHNNEGVEYVKPKIKVSGLEMIKSSTPSACRKKMEESIDIILRKNEQDMIDFIEKFREEFKTLPASEIAFPRGVNGLGTGEAGYKSLNKNEIFTKGTPIHVRGSLVYNHYIETKKLTNQYPIIKEGEKIKFLYLKEPNPIQSNVISFSTVIPKELDLDRYIDYNVQFQKAFIEPLKIILDCIGWKVEKTSTLESFFE